MGVLGGRCWKGRQIVNDDDDDGLTSLSTLDVVQMLVDMWNTFDQITDEACFPNLFFLINHTHVHPKGTDPIFSNSPNLLPFCISIHC